MGVNRPFSLEVLTKRNTRTYSGVEECETLLYYEVCIVSMPQKFHD